MENRSVDAATESTPRWMLDILADSVFPSARVRVANVRHDDDLVRSIYHATDDSRARQDAAFSVLWSL